MAENSSLSVRDLVVNRGGKRVLHGVSLDVRAQEITALVGANGAGKSSTVMAIAGALPIASGAVMLGARNLVGRAPDEIRRSGVAVVPEGHRVLGDLSVLDNLRVACLGLPRAEVADTIERALAIFPDLRDRLALEARALSGGQKQMVAMAQAFVARPSFLLVDELSLGLAPLVVKRLAQTLADVAASGVGVLLIEQFTTLALELATRAAVLERGAIVFSGSASELRARPEILHSAYLAATKRS